MPKTIFVQVCLIIKEYSYMQRNKYVLLQYQESWREVTTVNEKSNKELHRN